MPKNTVSDLVTDQEMTFARLVLSGTMTDRDAAQAAGLHPATASYTKSRPRVRAYMVEHRAAVEKKLAEQEAEGQHRLNIDRDQVLTRLWQIAQLSPETTRGSLTGQVKALAMIIAMQGLIPDRRAGSAEKESVSPVTPPAFYKSAWLREQQEQALQAQLRVEPAQEEEPDLVGPDPTPGLNGDAPNPSSDPAEPPFASCLSTSERAPAERDGAAGGSAADTRVPFWMANIPSFRRR